MAVLVEEYIGGLEISIDNEARVHVFEAKNDLGRVELHLLFGKDTVLRQMVMQVAAVHEVEQEAELVGCVKGIGHAHYEWRAVLIFLFYQNILQYLF